MTSNSVARFAAWGPNNQSCEQNHQNSFHSFKFISIHSHSLLCALPTKRSPQFTKHSMKKLASFKSERLKVNLIWSIMFFTPEGTWESSSKPAFLQNLIILTVAFLHLEDYSTGKNNSSKLAFHSYEAKFEKKYSSFLLVLILQM